MDWPLTEAKNKFSDLMNRALATGPQRVYRRKDAVFVIAEKEYYRLAGAKPDFKTYLCQGASFEGLDLKRSDDAGRDITL
jgi:antitoxin Phd